MTPTITETLGTVQPDGTLVLDQKVAMPPGRVKVRVEAVAASAQPTESLGEFVKRLRQELTDAGHQFRTKEEIDRELTELRDEWDERLDELDKLRQADSPEDKPAC